jgi:glycosyltransferase involved in cell wall biosynthesis
MKILHVCLACFYIDDYNYQENVLPKIHKKMGHDVKIIASTETYLDNLNLTYVKPSSYISSDGIPVVRLAYVHWLPHFISKKLRFYIGFERYLIDFAPDIIFLHDVQFFDVKVVKSFILSNPNVRVFADCHTDFINSANSWISKYVLHKIIYRYYNRIITPYLIKYFGTLPLRCDFLKSEYNVEKDKIELLPFGFDDTLVQDLDLVSLRNEIRLKYNINTSDIVIISGGKMDYAKNTLLLINAFNKLSKEYSNLKLLLFGEFSNDLFNDIQYSLKLDNIKYAGWQKGSDVYKLFFASDFVVFPGTHSVLWEEAIGIGLPGIFKNWDGIQHINHAQNCILVDNITEFSIYSALKHNVCDCSRFNILKQNANSPSKFKFLYSNIAKDAILE